MADSLVSLSNPRGDLVFRETAATSTLEQNVFAKTASTLYAVKIDASSNTGEDVYLAIYENTSATASGLIVAKCRAGKTLEIIMPCGVVAANTAYFHACVKTSAGTAGNTSPTGTVSFTLLGA